MASEVKHGAVAQVWFSDLDGTNKNSFLVRMDAYQESAVSFGKTTRLGDPVALGPGSGWRQLSWEGGALQDVWRDKAMYQSGNASPTSRAGGLRLWSGFDVVGKRRDPYITSYAIAAGSGDGTAVQRPCLYFAERTHLYAANANPSGGFKAYAFDPTANTYKQLNSTYPAALTNSLGNVLQGYSGFTAVCAATDDASSNEYVYFGTNLGLYIYYVTGDTWNADPNCTQGRIARDSMLSFKDALYYCADKKLWKRTPNAGGYGLTGTHTALAEHAAAVRTQGLAIWQNRLWYGVQYSGNRVAVGTSDGVTSAQAFQMPDDFQIGGLIAHYGALYIYGAAPQKVQTLSHAPSAVGQVWKYTGSSLTKVWESDDGTGRAWDDQFSAGVYCAATMGPLLLWGWSGQTGSTNERACVMAYDAEKDALVKGPQIPQHPTGLADGMLVTAMTSWNGTFAVAVRDLCGTYPGLTASSDTSVLVWKKLWAGLHDDAHNTKAAGSTVHFQGVFKGYSTEYVDPSRIQYIVSSEYYGGDDEIANMDKTWLTGQMRVKVPVNTTVDVYAITTSGNWYPPGYADVITRYGIDNRWRPFPQATGTLVASATYNGSSDWRQVSWNMTSGGTYLKSKRLRYAIVLTNTDTGNLTTTDTPEVDGIEFTWSVSNPIRRTWRLRIVADDGQHRLPDLVTGATNANPLYGRDDIPDKIYEYWSNQKPVLFYPPEEGPSNNLPTNAPITVTLPYDGYSKTQQIYVSSDWQTTNGGGPFISEIGLTLVEHV